LVLKTNFLHKVEMTEYLGTPLSKTITENVCAWTAQTWRVATV